MNSRLCEENKYLGCAVLTHNKMNQRQIKMMDSFYRNYPRPVDVAELEMERNILNSVMLLCRNLISVNTYDGDILSVFYGNEHMEHPRFFLIADHIISRNLYVARSPVIHPELGMRLIYVPGGKVNDIR
jgi:hypothetical protein